MQSKLEACARQDLERASRAIETLRRDPARLTPQALMHYADTMAGLDAAWDRARDAVEALAATDGEDAARDSAAFRDAWRMLEAELRRVQPQLPSSRERLAHERRPLGAEAARLPLADLHRARDPGR